ncbi:hypothetical protein LY76DRAFT_382570 [Colletotrichum caudatum]|nr:hypothetical protein LY76DRAFT_382570 [Colletotrichum caudatum]
MLVGSVLMISMSALGLLACFRLGDDLLGPLPPSCGGRHSKIGRGKGRGNSYSMSSRPKRSGHLASRTCRRPAWVGYATRPLRNDRSCRRRLFTRQQRAGEEWEQTEAEMYYGILPLQRRGTVTCLTGLDERDISASAMAIAATVMMMANRLDMDGLGGLKMLVSRFNECLSSGRWLDSNQVLYRGEGERAWSEMPTMKVACAATRPGRRLQVSPQTLSNT